MWHLADCATLSGSWEGCGRSWWWPVSRYSLGILDRITPRQNLMTVGICRDWNLAPPKSAVLPPEPVFSFIICADKLKLCHCFVIRITYVLHILCVREFLSRSSHLIVCPKDPNYSVCSCWCACSASWMCMNHYRFCLCVWRILQFLRDASYSVAHYRVLFHCVTGIKTNTSTLTGGETHNCL